MNELTELKSKYLNGVMGKHEYFSEIYSIHKYLFMYPGLISGSQVRKIEIDGNNVIFSLEILGNVIKLTSHPGDIHATGLKCLNMGEVEYECLEILTALMEFSGEDFLMLDIGANLGYYALSLMARFPKASCVAFEPIPDTFGLLRENIALNGLERRVRAVDRGLSNKDGEVRMYFNNAHSGTASLQNIENVGESGYVTVKTATLDGFAQNFNRPVALVKCDVEGAEKLVLEGGASTLRKDGPVILCEMMRKWSKTFGHHPNDTIELMRGMGYGCYAIRGGRLAPFNFMDEETEDMNFIFLHNAKSRNLIERFADE